MEILGYEIKFGKVITEPPEPKSTPVFKYPIQTQNQEFTRYKNVQGDQQLSYELIDGLYDRTIMNRVINKIAADCTRMNYSVRYIGLDGKYDQNLADLCFPVDVQFSRTVMRAIFRDMLKYGTSFLYVNYDASGVPADMYTIHPKYITPQITGGQVTGWEYMATGEKVILKPEELICFPNDPQTGDIFGKSLFGPVMQILELVLNSQYNTAILIERFALPIITWLLDSGIPEVNVTDKEIQDFLQSLFAQLDIGSDVAMDSKVDAKVLGTDGNLIDFIPIVQNLMYTFGVNVGVPLQLLGMPGDNLSVTTRIMQTYLESIRDYQENVGEKLIKAVYKPFLEKQQMLQFADYKLVDIDFPIQAVEENSKAITWIIPAINSGLISRTQGTNTLGFKGEAIPIEDMDVPNIQPEVVRPGAQKPNDPNKDPAPEPTGDPNKRKHD
jgi:hypothetical protein